MIKQTAQYIKENLNLLSPKIAIILGSGLSGFSTVLENTTVINYSDIPNFPQSTVAGHKGQLIKGYLGGKEIICLNGRFHLYEGHEPHIIANVIHILKELGIEQLIVTNAAGSLNANLAPGSLMLIKDHINFSGKNPLACKNNDNYGPRFPSMNNAYPQELRDKLKTIAKKNNIELDEGTYFMVLGPNFETSAEVKAFGLLGGDAVGMSTVPEVIVASHCSIKVLGISVITNYAAGLKNNTPSHQETLSEADKASNKLTTLVAEYIKEEG